ncbi:MAG: ABC transporter permease, partial [Acidobacteria bacterium]|nr:ABC transporter permease [Acidobacteriota bacterium]
LLWQDLKYALRNLRNSKGFTAVAVTALALGMGANTALFSIVYAVLLRPLPFPQAGRLVAVWEDHQKRGGPEREWTNPANFYDWADRSHSLEAMFALDGWGPTLTGEGDPERIAVARVTQGMFDTLRVTPQSGRAFTAAEDQPGGERVVLLSQGLWKRRFGGQASLVGRSIQLNGNPFLVVGILPEGFKVPMIPDTEAITPMQARRDGRGNAYIRVVARLKEDTTRDVAQAEMNHIAAGIGKEHPDTNADVGIVLVGLQEELAGPARPALLVLMGAVGLVLLMACANVANLLLARASARRKEIAVRIALGAGRGRLVRQLLTESVLLSAAGGLGGLFLAVWGVAALKTGLPEGFAQQFSVSLDRWVLGFTALLSVLSGIIFGIVPALQASRPNVSEQLKEGGRSAAGVAGHGRMRHALAAVEVGLSLMLLVGAGLLLKSFATLVSENPGFDVRNLVKLDLLLPPVKYPDPAQAAAFYERLVESVRGLPGVSAADVTTSTPFADSNSDTGFRIEGRPEPPPGVRVAAWYRQVSTDYLKTMGIPLVRGRLFDSRDSAQAPRVVLINESMAREYWPGENPVGKRIGSTTKWREIVGVVGNVRHFGLDGQEPPAMYLPVTQVPSPGMTLVVRSKAEPASVIAAVRRAVWSMDRDLAPADVGTMEREIRGSLADRRFTLLLIGLFAALALVLAVVGVYGVTAYSVSQRTHEIGVRMALGAQKGHVLKLVLRQGLLLTGAGVIPGVFGALALTRVMKGLLFGISPTDPATFAWVVTLLFAVSASACYVPARRAARMDPVRALRNEEGVVR